VREGKGRGEVGKGRGRGKDEGKGGACPTNQKIIPRAPGNRFN